MQPGDPERYRPLTPEEAAAWLKLDKIGYGAGTLERWAKEREIESLMFGKKRMFLVEHLVNFVRARTYEEKPRLRKIPRP